VPSPDTPPAGPALTGDEARAAQAALAVPGVMGMTAVLGRAVRLEERRDGTALPHRHARVEIVVRADHRALDVALEVRAAVSQALLPDHPTVTVLVTAVG
jgi:hypothetical protein